MQKLPCDSESRALRLRNRPGFTALAVVMLSLGVGATTALFSLVDGVVPPSTPNVRCETAMDVASGSPGFAIANVSNGGELRDRISDAYETSIESAGDAIGAIPDVAGELGDRPLIALLGACALGFLVVCARGASTMIASPRAPLVAIGTTVGALMFATLSLRALDLPPIGFRSSAFALCLSLVTVWYARLAHNRSAPLTI